MFFVVFQCCFPHSLYLTENIGMSYFQPSTHNTFHKLMFEGHVCIPGDIITHPHT